MKYVVMGEVGEYSDRAVYVFAVLSSLEEANSAVLALQAKRSEYDAWHNEYDKRLTAKQKQFFPLHLGSPARGTPEWEAFSAEWRLHREEVGASMWTEPEYVAGERFWVVPVEEGVVNPQSFG